MVLIMDLRRIKLPLRIDPYLTLGIKKDASPSETKSKFREKMNEVRNDDELRAKICLAYDVIVNKALYHCLGNNIYEIKDVMPNKPHVDLSVYYYVVIGDFFNLMKDIEDNDCLLYFKDPLKRSLLYIAARNGHVKVCEYLINKGLEINDIQGTGSTPLHGAVYYGQIEVVKLLLNYGAKTNIKNEYNHFPIDEAWTEEMKNLLKEHEQDPIVNLYNSLVTKNIAKSLVPITKNGSPIAKKIICKLNNLQENDNINEINKWIPAWHGTNFTCLESIAEIGLKPAGGKLKNGDELQVCISHIGRDKTIDKIPDWANGIFVSPSIFYCGYPAYAKEIASKNETYRVLVEVRVKPKSYYERESTCPKYILKNDEPKKLEYRIDAKNENDVKVVSLTFVKNEFFEKAKEYSEGKIFVTKYLEK